MQMESQGPNRTENADKMEEAENVQYAYYLGHANVMSDTQEGMAERVGFEPTLEFPLNTLSKRAPSATRPSLQQDVYHPESITVECFQIVPGHGVHGAEKVLSVA